MYLHDNTSGDACQMVDFLDKLKPKREWAKRSNAWLVGLTTLDQQARHARCGDYLTMLASEDLSKKKLETGFFCGIRLCPGCAWRASLENATCLSAIAQEMQSRGRVMLMVTLTVPNVPGDMLRAAMRRINDAWAKLMRRQRYKAAWSDNVRKMEITYNAVRDDYHPHLHVVVFVEPGYFATNRGKYISQAMLLHDWRECYECEEITQVNIVRCRDLAGRSQAVLEVAKYAAKASDFCHSEPVFRIFWQATGHMRMVTFAGACKVLRTEYNAGKLNKWLPQDPTKYIWRLIYQYFEGLGYIAEDVEAYTTPAPRGFLETRMPAPWDAELAAGLAEVT